MASQAESGIRLQKVTKHCEIRLTDVLKESNTAASPKMSLEIKQELFYPVREMCLRDRSQIKKPGRFEVKDLKKVEKNDDQTKKISKKNVVGARITDFFAAGPNKKKRKKFDESLDSDSDSLNKSHDSDAENKNIQNDDVDDDNDYAALVAKNIKEKMAFLQSLNIPQVQQEFLSSLPGRKPEPQGLSVKKIKEKIDTPKRTSKRLQRLEPDGKPLVDEPKLKVYQYPNSSDPYKTYTPRLPVTNALGLKQTCPTQADAVEQFLNGLSTDLAPHIQDDLIYNKEIMSSMVNEEVLVAKVVPDRIYSMAIHPRVTRRHLVAAGGKNGYLGIWDVGSSEGQDGVFLFRPCHDSINCLVFEPESLLCCSYEGTLKRFDLHQGEFHHLYATPDKVMTRCTHFDTVSQHCYIICKSDGCVVTVDTRTPGTKEEQSIKCHEKPVKTVNVHPIKRDYFITAANDGTVRLWDIRCSKNLKPVTEVSQKRSINCAYFSPVTGNAFLTVSYDDTVRIYDSTNLGPDLKQISSRRHDNQVGRWVTPFRGQWLPNQDDLFAIASKNYPRDIGVYHASTGLQEHSFTSDFLGSIVPIITFHPRLPSVAGGNASGKVYLFNSVN